MAAGYRLLLSDRVRGLTVAEAFEYVDAIQSYRGDWPLYLAPSAYLEGERPAELEGITPIPATHGALALVEFYVDEEPLSAHLSESLKVSPDVLRSALERGVPLHRLAPAEVVESLDVRAFLRAFTFEAAIPLRSEPSSELLDSLSRFEWLTDVDVVDVEVPGVDPELAAAELEASYYVGDYLRRLERLFARAATVANHLLLVRGEGLAQMRLTDVEAMVSEIVSVAPAVRAATMYYRLIPPL